ncbi:hypothetical protein [Natranaerobius trueperi]|uniref:Uncharacterized protein n=1 Tax=Natranaerobius trueperi TaxID=759412 RepID=A0A226BXJ6_9FIRM|nr:hypothetical protein [Natranaerobius trueperi]OWZ83758.1 hypothetical protein CDO51_06600 [Natranaerobius trueperi]
MYLPGLAGPLLFIISAILLLVLVPKKVILEKLIFGIVFGIGLAFILFYFLDIRFGFWDYRQVDLFFIADIPVFLSGTWTPLVILFVYFIKLASNFFTKIIVTLSFPLLAVISHFFFKLNEMLVYNNWNFFETFLMSFIVHLGIIGGLYIIGDLTVSKQKS